MQGQIRITTYIGENAIFQMSLTKVNPLWIKEVICNVVLFNYPFKGDKKWDETYNFNWEGVSWDDGQVTEYLLL